MPDSMLDHELDISYEGISNNELRRRLTNEFNFNCGPITPTTRKVLIKKLNRLEAQRNSFSHVDNDSTSSSVDGGKENSLANVEVDESAVDITPVVDSSSLPNDRKVVEPLPHHVVLDEVNSSIHSVKRTGTNHNESAEADVADRVSFNTLTSAAKTNAQTRFVEPFKRPLCRPPIRRPNNLPTNYDWDDSNKKSRRSSSFGNSSSFITKIGKNKVSILSILFIIMAIVIFIYFY